MEELQVLSFENTELSAWDFPIIKAELQRRLDAYAGLVYTDDTIKDAKKDRATLGKVKTAINNAEKAYKAKCMAPYDAIKPQIKELIDLVDEQRSMIDSTVKDFEARQKAEKEQAVRAFYDRKAVSLGSLAEPLYEQLFDSKWTNASTGKAKYEEAIQVAINQSVLDIEEIRSWNSPFVDTLIEVYVATLSVETTKSKNVELIESAKKAGLTNQPAADPAIPVVSESVKTDAEAGVTMKIYASGSQLNQIMDFMKAIGVKYDVL